MNTKNWLIAIIVLLMLLVALLAYQNIDLRYRNRVTQNTRDIVTIDRVLGQALRQAPPAQPAQQKRR